MMVYNQSDSDGTDDDDLPPTQMNRPQPVRRGRPSGNGKASSSVYIEQQIRHLELDAYTALLRAFSAQSEAITWTKEGLMSDMRKELRVADEQHREILGKVGQDETLRRIRTWRQTGEDPGLLTIARDPSPSPAVSNSRKKQKTGHAAQAFPPPPPLLKSAPVLTGPSPSPAPSGHVLSKGRKSRSKEVGVTPIAPTRGTALGGAAGITPSRGGVGSGRGVAPWSNHKGAGPSSDTRVDSWVGRKVRTKWPDDQNFYEAVVAEYNKDTMLHCLVYDSGSAKETWEWVDLKGMDKNDVQWIDGPPVVLEGKAPPSSAVGRGLGRGIKRGRGSHGGAVGRPKGSQRGRPALSHDKLPPTPTPQSRPWRGGGPGDVERNGTDKKVNPTQIEFPDVEAFKKEADDLEHENDLEKLKSIRRTVTQHEEMLQRALVEVGESSEEAASDDGRNHGTDSPVHSGGLEKEHHSIQDTGDPHADSEGEDDTGEERREDGSEGNLGGAQRGSVGSDAELDNADDEDGEGDDDR